MSEGQGGDNFPRPVDNQTSTGVPNREDSPAATSPKVEGLPDAYYQIATELIGADKSTTLDQAIRDIIKNKLTPTRKQKVEDAFAARGIDVPAEACPEFLGDSIGEFTEEEWKFIQSSDTTAVAIYAIDNYHYRERGRRIQPGREQDHIFLRSLPLIHGTTYEALKKIMEKGHLLTNRELFESEGARAIDFASTYSEDRKVGLDQYIFADFGRPHSDRGQADVNIVLFPSALDQPGTIITEEDYLDAFARAAQSANQDHFEEKVLKDYLGGLSMPPYFYDDAVSKILRTENGTRYSAGMYTPEGLTISQFAQGAGDKRDSRGNVYFSTWEVKLPEAATDKIAKVIFKKQEDMDRFKEQFGEDKFEIVFEPDLRKGNYAETLRIKGEYDRAEAKYKSEVENK